VITGKDRLTWSCNASPRATEDAMTYERIALAELLHTGTATAIFCEP